MVLPFPIFSFAIFRLLKRDRYVIAYVKLAISRINWSAYNKRLARCVSFGYERSEDIGERLQLFMYLGPGTNDDGQSCVFCRGSLFESRDKRGGQENRYIQRNVIAAQIGILKTILRAKYRLFALRTLYYR